MGDTGQVPPHGTNPHQASVVLVPPPWTRVLARLTICAAILTSCGQTTDKQETPRSSSAPLPVPALDHADPAVREQLEAEAERARTSLAAATSDRERAEARGRLARFHHAYDLLEPAEAGYRAAHDLVPEDPQWTVSLAAVLERRGRFEEASGLLAAVAEKGPVPESVGPAALELRRGRIALRLGDDATAETHFRRALDASPVCFAARFGLGEVARERGEVEDAIEHYRAVLAVQPGATQVQWPLAQALLKAGRHAEAQPLLEAVEAAPRSGVGGRPSCPDPLDAALAELTTGAASHLRRSQQAFFAGNLAREVEELEKALALAPDDPPILQALGRALLRAERPAEAEGHYRHLLERTPGDLEALRGVASALMAQGRRPEALAWCRDATARAEGEPTLWLQRAAVAQAVGGFEEALAAFERVLELDATSTPAGIGRALILGRLGRVDEAGDALIATLEHVRPEAAGERLRIATALLGMGRTAEARAELERLSESTTADAEVRARAQQLLARLG